MKLTFYKDKKKEWRWKITSANGRKLANSGEGYKTRAGAHKTLAKIITNCALGRYTTEGFDDK
jgi:uncharacterized protein YegP (UPF0339 family)